MSTEAHAAAPPDAGTTGLEIIDDDPPHHTADPAWIDATAADAIVATEDAIAAIERRHASYESAGAPSPTTHATLSLAASMLSIARSLSAIERHLALFDTDEPGAAGGGA